MSRQLAISASFSILAMSAFALSYGHIDYPRGAPMQTGAPAHASAPALPERVIPLIGFPLS